MKGDQRAEGPAAIAAMQQDLEEQREEEVGCPSPTPLPLGLSLTHLLVHPYTRQEEDDEEVLEMFDELAKGKDYITEKVRARGAPGGAHTTRPPLPPHQFSLSLALPPAPSFSLSSRPATPLRSSSSRRPPRWRRPCP